MASPIHVRHILETLAKGVFANPSRESKVDKTSSLLSDGRPGVENVPGDENVPRGKWPLGRVIDVFHGNDGYVRSARVQTSLTILTRPVTKLCFLEGQKAH